MSSVNKVILVGNLGADPELRFTQTGTPVANFTLATNSKYTNKDGEKQEEVTWHNISAWGKTAELCSEYINKGSKIYIEGKIRNSKYETKEGVEKFKSEVVAHTVVFLDKKPSGCNDCTDCKKESGDNVPF